MGLGEETVSQALTDYIAWSKQHKNGIVHAATDGWYSACRNADTCLVGVVAAHSFSWNGREYKRPPVIAHAMIEKGRVRQQRHCKTKELHTVVIREGVDNTTASVLLGSMVVDQLLHEHPWVDERPR